MKIEKDFIEEFDDKYKVSINALFYYNSPLTSINQIKNLLDKNGYYGRNNIQKITEAGLITDKIKIYIYLPSSNYTYAYPFKTYYNLSEKRFLPPKPKTKIDPAIKEFMCKLLDVTGNEDKEFDSIDWLKASVRVRSSFGYIRTNEVVDQLMQFGLIVKGKFVLKNDEDINELYENLFSTNKFNLY